MILETEVVSNNNIVLFENEELGQVRVAVDENNEPLFCLSDICKILELTTPSKVADSIKREFELYELSSYSFDIRHAIDLCNDAISNNFLSRKLI
ncbi:BRO family protein [Campylobacter jejuni]